MASQEDHLIYARRINARMRAKAIGLNPDELDFEEAEQRPSFNPNGTMKSVEITALLRLIEKRWYEENKPTAKRTSRTRSAAA